jgi:hypothetical protein
VGAKAASCAALCVQQFSAWTFSTQGYLAPIPESLAPDVYAWAIPFNTPRNANNSAITFIERLKQTYVF